MEQAAAGDLRRLCLDGVVGRGSHSQCDSCVSLVDPPTLFASRQVHLRVGLP
jgi:hypothetical protein